METTTLQPTTKTEKALYYELKEGNITKEVLKELIPESFYKDYDFSYDDDSLSIKIIGKDSCRHHISLKTVYSVKVQDGVCFSLNSMNFSVTIYEDIKYIHTILF